MNTADWWIKETTIIPIDHLILAINYLKMRFGNGIRFGENTVEGILTEVCLEKMIDAGYLIKKDAEYYFLA